MSCNSALVPVDENKVVIDNNVGIAKTSEERKEVMRYP
jgi:hypothetical protein